MALDFDHHQILIYNIVRVSTGKNLFPHPAPGAAASGGSWRLFVGPSLENPRTQ